MKKNGVQWNHAPAAHRPPTTLYDRFLRWSRMGVFARIFPELAARAGRRGLKRSQEIGQRAKPYPDPLEGYEMAKRRKVSDRFKAQVAHEALRGDMTVQEIAAQHQVHP